MTTDSVPAAGIGLPAFRFPPTDALPASEEKLIDFRARRERLSRWHRLEATKPFRHVDLVIDREDGRAPEVQILRFPDRHPASPGSYGGGTMSRALP